MQGASWKLASYTLAGLKFRWVSLLHSVNVKISALLQACYLGEHTCIPEVCLNQNKNKLKNEYFRKKTKS